MISFLWGWFTSWIIGWGGVGVLVTVAAWAAWFLSPVFKDKFLLLAIGLTMFTVSSTVFFTQGYSRGYDEAIEDLAKLDQAAVDRAGSGLADIKACRARGGTWDVTTGACR